MAVWIDNSNTVQPQNPHSYFGPTQGQLYITLAHHFNPNLNPYNIMTDPFFIGFPCSHLIFWFPAGSYLWSLPFAFKCTGDSENSTGFWRFILSYKQHFYVWSGGKNSCCGMSGLLFYSLNLQIADLMSL